MEKVRVIVYGTGAIGNGAIRMMSDIDWIEIVGGINSAGEKVGKDLGEVASVGQKLGIIVSDDPEAVFAQAKADIVLHTVHITAGAADDGVSQVLKAVNAGLNVITVGDFRLAYPWIHWPELGRRVDEAAKKNGVTVVYTGANPGFMMDLLPIVFTGACESVKKIRIEILGDIGNVGAAVFNMLGFGMTVDEFKETRTIIDQMPSLPQIDLIADALGWKLDELKRASEPIIAKKGFRMPSGFEVTPGKVCGTKLLYEGIKDGETVITASWGMMIGLEEEGLEEIRTIHIEGKPNIEVSYKLGTTNIVTWARIVNTIPQVIEARPGLLTVRDLPVVVALK